MLTTVGQLPVLRWPALDNTGVVEAIVTTTGGGISTGPYESLNLSFSVGDDPASVVENRARSAKAVGLDLDDLVFCKQSHGRAVAQVTTADRGRGTRPDRSTKVSTSTDGIARTEARTHAAAIADTDALVTTDTEVGLVVMVADCVPIVMVDPDAMVLACVHAGWRGTVQRVTQAAVEEMARLGADPAAIIAGIGPAIPADRYQVGQDVFDAAGDAFGPKVDQVISEDGTGKWLFDVWEANRLVLAESGVTEDHIHLADIGTGTGEFFSHRATNPGGRFAAIAKLKASQ